jgi:hypothetical protein
MSTHLVPFPPHVSRAAIKPTSKRVVNTDRIAANPVDRIHAMVQRLSEHDPGILVGIQTMLEELLHALKLDLPTTPSGPSRSAVAAGATEPSSSRLVTLTSGATVMLAVSVDVLRLSPAERQLVFAILEQLEAYEQTRPDPASRDSHDE